MFLQSLQLVNFKNCASAEYHFEPGVNCLVGENGAGKTNVLDAIYYLAHCKSYFNPIDSQNIRHDEPFFVIQGKFDTGDHVDTVHCGMKRGQKKMFRREGKEYNKLSEHIGRYPVVIISPYDKDLVYEGSDVRRKFIDGIIAALVPAFSDQVDALQWPARDSRRELTLSRPQERMPGRVRLDVTLPERSAPPRALMLADPPRLPEQLS